MISIRACLITAALVAAGIAQAQTAPATKAEDSSLTWKGITLYGIVDIGLQYDTHSAPFSDYFPPGSASLVQKNDYDSPIGLTPSNLSQSRIGISGNEPLWGDWAGIFKFETFFNPQSGNISDACKSVTLNNGKALTAQTVGVDSSICGQLFSGVGVVGLSSPTVGTFTLGRNVTLLADGIGKYDPLSASNAFSLIGFSGTAAGGGDTEDRRLDQSVKYYARYDWLHVGALYQFGSSSGSVNTGYQLQIGGELAGFSVDAYYFKKYDAIGIASLSAVQLADAVAAGYSASNSVAATVSDNETYAVMGLYDFGKALPLKLMGGYEHIAFNNPNTPLPAGTIIIGGYLIGVTPNPTPFNNQKTLQVFWAGLRYTVAPNVDLLASYYGYKQNSCATGANAGCSDTRNGGCSGTENVLSLVFVYKMSKRFDLYGGSMWSGVRDGLANGYINKDNVATSVGVRFKF